MGRPPPNLPRNPATTSLTPPPTPCLSSQPTPTPTTPATPPKRRNPARARATASRKGQEGRLEIETDAQGARRQQRGKVGGSQENCQGRQEGREGQEGRRHACPGIRLRLRRGETR